MSIKNNLKNSVMRVSRLKKLNHFYSYCEEGMTVLDVGVSKEDSKGLPARNYFLKHFRYPGQYYTGLGVQDLSTMRALFPDKRFVQYSGGTFPFEDRKFDWVFSNAVIEHVGDDADQLEFLNEMLRVAKNIFFTTPNKHFPIEVHTNVLFLHWNDWLFYRWLAGREPFRTKNNLYVFSYSRLRNLLENSNSSEFRIFRNRFWGLTMTFTVMCRE